MRRVCVYALGSPMRHLIVAIAAVLLLCPASAIASRPIIGVAGVEGGGAMGSQLAGLMTGHLNRIVGVSGVFDQVNPALLRDQLARFDCLEASCMIRFARTAKISVIALGAVDDNGGSVTVELAAYGIDAPYFGKVIYRYRAMIPTTGRRPTGQQLSYFTEEHAGIFVAELVRRYRIPAAVMRDGSRAAVRFPERVDGSYDLYRFDEVPATDGGARPFRKVGTVTVENSAIVRARPEGADPADGDFILATHAEKARFLSEFNDGRKRELVLEKTGVADTLWTALFTVPASATMPLAAPILGYYRHGDFEGLALWALNVAPYLYVEVDGLMNPPEKYRADRRDVSNRTLTHHYFGWYFMLVGGMSLFVDAFSHHYLDEASKFRGPQPLMGNGGTAAYLALICGGGGHFYRGHRAWGYFYFHLDNIMLYMAIRELVGEERYNPETQSYERGAVNTGTGYALLGAFGVIKIIELVHALLIKDNLRSGTVVEEEFAIEPLFMIDRERRMQAGVMCTFRY